MRAQFHSSSNFLTPLSDLCLESDSRGNRRRQSAPEWVANKWETTTFFGPDSATAAAACERLDCVTISFCVAAADLASHPPG